MLKKYPNADLRMSYPLVVETGIIMALLLLIICANISMPERSANKIEYVPADETALILPPIISNEPTLKTPPVPIVPIKIPNDAPFEPPPIEMDEFNHTARLLIPPLPQEIKAEVNYDLLKGIEQLPTIIGGEEAFRNSIEYPEHARRIGLEGIVEVEFMVTESGKVEDPVIVKGIGGGCDKAVLQAIKLQRYTPGKKGGNTTSFKIREIVQFILLDA